MTRKQLLNAVQKHPYIAVRWYDNVVTGVNSKIALLTGKTKYQRQVNAPFLDGKTRSKLNPFLARAMAEQWG